MKNKILILAVFLGLTGISFGQSTFPQAKVTAEEVNRQNGTPKEPTINGIPYSQYKAQQEAKKQQRQQPMQTPVMGDLTMEVADNSVNPMEARKVNQTPTAISPVLTEQPVINNTQVDPNSRSGALNARNDASAQTFDPSTKQSPANNTRPVVTEPAVSNDPAARNPNMVPIEEKTNSVTIDQKNVTNTEYKRPEVPEQFRLQSNQTWNGTPISSAVNNSGGVIQNGSDDKTDIKVNAPVLTTSVKEQTGTSTTVKHERPVLDAKLNNAAGVTNKPQAAVQNTVTPGGGAIGVSVPTTGDPSSKQSPTNNTPVAETPKDPTLKNGVPEKTKSE